MLAGLKVLDLTRVLAGPLATMLLGDLGADVIKIERPGTGDDTRGWGPPFDADGRSAYYLSVNRNKLDVAADLDNENDRALIERLMSDADIVIDNFLPGTLERRGISADIWRKRRPELIWCTITGFGLDAVRPGYDFVAQAESGWMSITGEPNGNPLKTGVAFADLFAGKDAAIAILAAVVKKARTGEGSRIVISLLDSARAMLVNVGQNVMISGQDARRWGNGHPNLVPYQMFMASDAPIIIAVGSNTQWVPCARAVGLDHLANDPELSTNAGRIAQRDRVLAEFTRQLETQTAAVWRAKLDAAGVPNGVVLSVLQALQGTTASALTGMPSSVGGSIRFPPPAIDEHGEKIRRDGWAVFHSGGER
jgi:crotonobetainyl-CoA:carnitine CoA-transferase CaiB-like acyl-CoA transferase